MSNTSQIFKENKKKIRYNAGYKYSICKLDYIYVLAGEC